MLFILWVNYTQPKQIRSWGPDLINPHAILRLMIAKGIKFVREPKEEYYGLVAVFEDLYGNLWDLLQLNKDHPISKRAV